jgi:hypothetical protein
MSVLRTVLVLSCGVSLAMGAADTMNGKQATTQMENVVNELMARAELSPEVESMRARALSAGRSPLHPD